MNINIVCLMLADKFGCPCNYSPIDEEMYDNEQCVDDCGKLTDAQCWERYIETVEKRAEQTERSE